MFPRATAQVEKCVYFYCDMGYGQAGAMSRLTHWPLGDLNAILDGTFSS